MDPSLRKGILLAGGSGHRLYPTTVAVNKHLFPVYDKPLIYYPLTTLMLAGIDDILIVSSPNHLPTLRQALMDGRQWGVRFSYAEQARPGGVAEALAIGADFVGGDPFSLILGDNVFFGYQLTALLARGVAAAMAGNAAIYTFRVVNPRSFGVLELDEAGRPLALTEKPNHPRSDRAVTGLYFYPSGAVERVRDLTPSKRGELEITDINRSYLDEARLVPIHLSRGMVWFDAGTSWSLQRAASFVEILQTRQNTGIAFPEEVAHHMGWIDLATFRSLTHSMPNSAYRDYLANLVKDLEMEADTQAGTRMDP